MATDSEWVRMRLPSNAHFTKNGVTRTPVTAADEALAAHSTETNSKMRALADLLRVLAAELKWNAEKNGEWSGTGNLLEKRAEYWEDVAESSGAAVSGQFGFVPATFGNEEVTDEYSS